jgi:ATP-dependent HslUV protease ATP-binding subunit HslU
VKLPRIHLQWARGGGAEVAAPGRASSELAGATLSLADLVLPDAVDAGRFPDRVYVPPDRWIRVYAVKALPDRLSVGWLSELLATEGVEVAFAEDGLDAIAQTAQQVNEQTENIGARRLHTLMEKLLEDVSFEAPEGGDRQVVVDAAYVTAKVGELARDLDLARYIL